MRTTSSVWLVVTMLVVWPLTADAQESVAAPTRVEVSAVVSGVPGTDHLGLGVRVSGRTGGRSSIEVGLDWTDALHTKRLADQVVWFYFWQMRHNFWTKGRTSLFATYGTSGWIDRTTAPPGRLKLAVVPPFLPLVGAGAQHVLASRLAVRVDGQFRIWPFETGLVAARVAASVVVPIGRYAH